MKRLFLLLVILFPLTLTALETDYQFIGKHLVISYLGCDSAALENETLLKEKMVEAANATGVTILSSADHHFQPKGFTQMLLLSESHASIHTYPEYKACFVDLFTCGTSFDMATFDEVLSSYLQPKKVSCKMLERGDNTEEVCYTPKSDQKK